MKYKKEQILNRMRQIKIEIKAKEDLIKILELEKQELVNDLSMLNQVTNNL
jgi:SMC interacting uncharacterized protein involved in chromosome segregation